MPQIAGPRKSDLIDPRREVTIGALKRVVDPLVELIFDAGVTVRELNQLVRESAVRNAANRVCRENGRHSTSRVAIITGLPRSEVARILMCEDTPASKPLGQHPARRVLAAWFDNARFLAPNGDPAVLPIFGKRRSFEQLVVLNSGGIPVRAMLDELTQMDAVERLADQRVRVKSRLPVSTGVSSSAIEAVGDRTRDLLDTLTYNLRHRAKPLFEATAIADETDHDLVAVIRREIAEQGSNFINGANSLFSRHRTKQGRTVAKVSTKCRLGVTVYYFQDDIDGAMESGGKGTVAPRKNLRRQLHSASSKKSASLSSGPRTKGPL